MRNLQCGILLAAFSLVSNTVALAGTEPAASDSASSPVPGTSIAAPEVTPGGTAAISGPVLPDQPPLNIPEIMRSASGKAEVDTQTVDSPEAIKSANQFHKQAIEQLQQSQLPKAIELESEAMKAAPHYWLPRATAAYLYYKRGDKMNALSQAGQSVRTPHPFVAELNFATMLRNVRWYGPAAEQYKRALKTQPDSWRAKIGLADCYISAEHPEQAQKLLDELITSLPTDAEAYAAIGNSFSKLGDFTNAETYLKKAVSMNNTPEFQNTVNDILFITAVRAGDLETTKSLIAKVTNTLSSNEKVWLRAGNLLVAGTPTEAKAALQLAISDVTTDREARDLAAILKKKATEAANEATRKAWLELVQTALDHAIVLKPDELRNRLLEAGAMEQKGNIPEALKLLSGLLSQLDTRADEKLGDQFVQSTLKRMHKDEWQTVSKAFVATKNAKDATGEGYRSYLAEFDYKLPKATCHCRYNTIRQLIRQQAGVVDVVIGKGKNPLCMAIFDTRKTNVEKIFSAEAWKHLTEEVEKLGVKPIPTITAVANLLDQQDDLTPRLLDATMQQTALQLPALEENSQKVSSEKSGSL